MGVLEKNWVLLKVYLIAGTLTFSGGMAMLPLIEKELVKKRGWIEKEALYSDAAIAQTLPGVIALNTAFLIGKRTNGVAGMLFAGLGAILPAFVLMSVATAFYQLMPKIGPLLWALTGVRATSAAFLFAAAYSIARFNLKTPLLKGIALFALIFAATNLISVPLILVIAAVLGMLFYRRPAAGKGGK